MTEIDWFKGVIVPYGNLLLFLAILIYFARKPIADMVAARRSAYQKLLAEASAARDQAMAKTAELETRLANLDKELEEIRVNSMREAELESKIMLEKAETLASNIRRDAAKAAEAQTQQAQEALQAEILASVGAAIRSKISSDYSADNHLALVKEGIQKLRADAFVDVPRQGSSKSPAARATTTGEAQL